MSQTLPTISAYNQAILQHGISIFKTLKVDNFIPCITRPIKIYSYGSGSYAVVFKVIIGSKYYALRCFLSSEENLHLRYKALTAHLNNLQSYGYFTNCRYYEEEIQIDKKYYPVVLMDWVDGLHINDYITKNIDNKSLLAQLQEKLIKLSDALRASHITHGDLQSGNILITQNNDIKLIDYDATYIPAMAQKSYERGHPDFQHPKRSPKDIREQIDWFSIWVMLTAIEAVKMDTKLWNKVYAGGYNTQDNFLFKADDYAKNEQSDIFRVLLEKNNKALNFYVSNLLKYCKGDLSIIDKPALFNNLGQNINPNKPNYNPPSFQDSNFTIKSNLPAIVLTQKFQKIGETPCMLEKSKFFGKKIILSHNSTTKIVTLDEDKDIYNIEF